MLYDDGLGLPPAPSGDGHRIEAVLVPRWAPEILTSEAVAQSQALEIFGYRTPAKFTAPEIIFSNPEPLLVRGGSFTVVAERGGVVPVSTYLFGDYDWKTVFAPSGRITTLPDGNMLIAGNAVAYNYYHWTFQCLAPMLIALEKGIGRDPAFVVPPLHPIQRAGLELAEIDPARVHEVRPDDLAVTNSGIHNNLVGGGFAFVPHPAILAAFEALGSKVVRSRFVGRRIFVSRADAAKRAMVNEAALAEALTARGFDVVILGEMPLAEQIGLFRDAAVVVAQHGAALTNLLYAMPGPDGPAIVELHQENYLQQAFLKLCQVKRLRYAAVINPMVDAGPDGRHQSTWRADIPLVLRAIDQLQA